MLLKQKNQKHQKGFTLIEVMVALVVAAVALTALTQGLGQYVFQQSGLQQRVVATWVAQNRLLEIQQSLGETIQKKSTVAMMGNEWQVQFETQNTLIPSLKKIELKVRTQSDAETKKAPTAIIYSVIGE